MSLSQSTNPGESKAIGIPAKPEATRKKAKIREKAEEAGKDFFKECLDKIVGSNSQINRALESINIFDTSFSVDTITTTFKSGLQSGVGEITPEFIMKAHELFTIGDVIKKEIEEIKKEVEEFNRDEAAQRISKKLENALAKNTHQLLKGAGLPTGFTSAFESVSTTPNLSRTNSGVGSGSSYSEMTTEALESAANKIGPVVAIGAVSASLDGGGVMAAGALSFAMASALGIAGRVVGQATKNSIHDLRRHFRDSIREQVKDALEDKQSSISPGIELESNSTKDGAASPENSSRRASIDSESESETQPLLGYAAKTKTSMSCLGCFPVMPSISNAIINIGARLVRFLILLGHLRQTYLDHLKAKLVQLILLKLLQV